MSPYNQMNQDLQAEYTKTWIAKRAAVFILISLVIAVLLFKKPQLTLNISATKSDYDVTEYWTPDWMIEKNFSKLFESRIKRVREQCKLHKAEISKTISESYWRNNNVLDRDKRIITSSNDFSVCILPKAGTTFWKSFAVKVHQLRDPGGHLFGASVNEFWGKKISLLKPRGSKATVAFITRNPWQRLVSVYIQKILNPPSLREKLKFYRFCQYKKRDTMTFKSFLLCVAEGLERGEYNSHWEPVFRHCDICNHEYTTPIVMENMKAETLYIMKSLGINSTEDIIDTARNATMREVEAKKLSHDYINYYQELPNLDIVERLRNLYQIDLDMFGYPHSPFVIASNQTIAL